MVTAPPACTTHALPVLALVLALALSAHQAQGLSTLEVGRRQALVAAGTAAVSPQLMVPSVAGASEAAKITRTTKLSNGDAFSWCSFGLQVYDDETARKLTLTALECGYRNFFSSVLAGNQRGFARAVRESGIDRKELFICGSVVSNRARGFQAAYEATARGCRANMGAFAAGNIDQLDCIMLDYPGPDAESIQGQWKAFEQMKADGLVRSLAVSNFDNQQLDAVLSVPGATVPVLNQLPLSVAYHPAIEAVVEANKQRGVLVQAWAPLGGSLGGRFNKKVVQACSAVGAKYNKSAYQVALRWLVQKGCSFTTQTSRREHFVEDLDIFDFELSDEDMASLGRLA